METEVAKPQNKIHEIHFAVENATSFGEEMAAVGENDFLGNWNLDNALKLSWTAGNIWRAVYTFPNEPHNFEFKYVTLVKNGNHRWEPGNNRKFEKLNGQEEDDKVIYDVKGVWPR